MEELLLEARTCLESGRVPEAEQLCRRVLDQSPDCPDALHYLGVAHLQQGRLEDAVGLLERAVANDGADAMIRNSLGVALAGLRRYQEAVASFQVAVSLNSRFPDGHYNLAKALRAAGRIEEAVASYRTAVDVQPNRPEIHYDLANALRALGRFDDAVASYREALRLRPDYVKALVNLGNICRELRRFAEAEACLRQVVRYQSDYTPGYVNLGALAFRRKAYEEAERHFQRALELDASHVGARAGLGKALAEQGKLEEAASLLDAGEVAEESLLEARLRLGDKLRTDKRHDEAIAVARQVLQLKPDFAMAYQNLGLALAAKGDLDEAVVAYRRAVDLRPDSAEAHNNLAVALQTLGDDEATMHHLDMALSLRPGLPVAYLNRSVLRLRQGDFAAGWQEFEWRRLCPEHRLRRFPKPLWMGQALPGGTLLLHSEQGLGDTVQFIRYARLAKERVGTLIVECQRQLTRLLSRCPWIDRLVARGVKPPDHDAQAPMASLPLIFQTRLDTIPAEVPYITADEELVAAWRNRLAEYPGFKVGIAWQGSPKYAGDAYRSLPLRHFASLAAVEGVRLISLQKGHGAEQLAELAGAFPVTDLGADLDTASGGFMDTAAIVQDLDLVACSDSAIAHLVGAMGRPVWVALSTAADWRWLKDREDNPWYPTMRLFRQRRLGDWDELFSRIAGQLQRVVEGDSSRLRPSIVNQVKPIEIPVAPGELLDRLSILEIKREWITDEEELVHVRAEYDRLQVLCQRAIRPSGELSRLAGELRSVNQRLWDIENAIRACEARQDFGQDFVELARSVYQTNDRRTAIKREIDMLLGSTVIEQKHYTSYGH